MPAHGGIERNEKANKLGKETIKDGSIEEQHTNTSYSSNTPNLPYSSALSTVSLTRSKLYQQRFARPTKKMAPMVTRQKLKSNEDLSTSGYPGHGSVHMAARWDTPRTLQRSSVQCIVSRVGIHPSPVSHRTLKTTERPVSDRISRYGRMRV